ncbi:hypothetical protein [Pontibacter anaerobius]|uniref:Carboxypeptidase regulatory-like domain-containing protein n=1 Tax=Pontibacter anaerobius TaxID=2993940 RepID=A0ABT3RBH4_9BACT|nr:hypothetical protein [Pontibacter anaerobius]MCX2738870.1 hypothetical protein [Pontibacter anaerobius]
MKTASIILALAFSVFLFCGCGKEESDNAPSQWVNNIEELKQLNQGKITITQGIAGTLTLIEGNCMPIIGPNSTCKEYPVKRKLAIYPYTTLQETVQHEAAFYTINAEPLMEVETDAEGFYQTKLSPGTYSVFIEEKGKLYANGFDGQGGINPVHVDEDVVESLNLRLNYAVY